jgi:uncharacterized membrane protein
VISIALGTFCAVVWGAADFCGGKGAQGGAALTVSVVSKLASLPLLALCLAFLPAVPDLSSLAWAVGAGLIGVSGLVVFYRALAAGAMVVVAPISAVTAAVVPMVVGLFVERTPQPTALIGVICAVVSIALISAVRADGPTVVTVALVGWSLASGLGFGMFSVLLNASVDAAGRDVGLWPVVAAQGGALVLGAVLLAGRRTAPVLPRRPLRWAIAAGVLDMTANVLLLLAVRGGLLSIVGPLAAMYPVSTVLLARTVDREPIRPMQFAGLGLAAVALVLVAS